MPSSRRTASALLAELKRRQVRVGLDYVVVAWLMAQVAATMFPFLRLPDWTVTLVQGLLMIGFPLALVPASALDLTPHGCDDVPAAPDALERAQSERAPQLTCRRVEPLLDPLRSEPRFMRLIEQAGLTGPARVEVAS